MIKKEWKPGDSLKRRCESWNRRLFQLKTGTKIASETCGCPTKLFHSGRQLLQLTDLCFTCGFITSNPEYELGRIKLVLRKKFTCNQTNYFYKTVWSRGLPLSMSRTDIWSRLQRKASKLANRWIKLSSCLLRIHSRLCFFIIILMPFRPFMTYNFLALSSSERRDLLV